MKSRFRPSAAFTLVELLIATAITILMVAFLGQVILSATTVWRSADQRMDAFRDARAALQLMSSDLGRANTSGDPGMLNLANYPSGFATEAYAITPVKNTANSSFCTVGYYLDWNATTKTYSLRRFLKDGNTTAALLANSPLNYGALYDRTSGTTPETIASYVWDLEFRPGEGANTVTVTADPPNKWHWVEIRFKAMSVKAGRTIQAINTVSQSTWADPNQQAYKTYILPNQQQFVTRVMLQQNR